MLNQVKKFLLDDSGLETVEWAIVGGVIVAVGAALFITIGADVKNGITALDTATSGIPALVRGAANQGKRGRRRGRGNSHRRHGDRVQGLQGKVHHHGNA